MSTDKKVYSIFPARTVHVKIILAEIHISFDKAARNFKPRQ
jgi:hypothetical protein